MPAAILMPARSLLRFFVKDCPSPAETLKRLKNALLLEMPPAKFVTAIYGLLIRSRWGSAWRARAPAALAGEWRLRFIPMDPGLPLGLTHLLIRTNIQVRLPY
jgi:hypothetical protein